MAYMCIFFLQLGWVEISLSTHTSVLRKQTANSKIPYSIETMLGFFLGTIKSSKTLLIKYSWFCPSANVQVDKWDNLKKMWRRFRIYFCCFGFLWIKGWIMELDKNSVFSICFLRIKVCTPFSLCVCYGKSNSSQSKSWVHSINIRAVAM